MSRSTFRLDILATAFLRSYEFSTQDDALNAQSAIREVASSYINASELRMTVGRVLPTLAGDTFGNADADMLDALAVRGGNRVAAIKWLRNTSGCGLKEAKVWLDENFPMPPAEPVEAPAAPKSLVDVFREAAGITGPCDDRDCETCFPFSRYVGDGA
jgi:ribosomal protein L7/L12